MSIWLRNSFGRTFRFRKRDWRTYRHVFVPIERERERENEAKCFPIARMYVHTYRYTYVRTYVCCVYMCPWNSMFMCEMKSKRVCSLSNLCSSGNECSYIRRELVARAQQITLPDRLSTYSTHDFNVRNRTPVQYKVPWNKAILNVIARRYYFLVSITY